MRESDRKISSQRNECRSWNAEIITPLNFTPDGAVIAYARAKCAAISLAAITFATLMIITDLDLWFRGFDGTPLERIEIRREPAWLWGGIMLTGGATVMAITAWLAIYALGSGTAIEITDESVTARTFIGRRASRESAAR